MSSSAAGHVCPYLLSFQPGGRDYTYQLCEAIGDDPLVPSLGELARLCHGDFTRCPRYRLASAKDSGEPVAAKRAA